MTADLATLRALATQARDAYAGTETDDNCGYTCAICSSDFHVDDECEPTNLCRSCAYDCADKCAAGLADACDEIEVLRAQVAGLTIDRDRLSDMVHGEIERRFIEARAERDEEIEALRLELARRWPCRSCGAGADDGA